jgi:hypothetical protein
VEPVFRLVEDRLRMGFESFFVNLLAAVRRQTGYLLITQFGARVHSAGNWHAPIHESPPNHFDFRSAAHPPGSETTRAAEFPILSLAAPVKVLLAALHLDCARFADGRSVSVAFEEQLLIPRQYRIEHFAQGILGSHVLGRLTISSLANSA